jgi:hypothetical protein
MLSEGADGFYTPLPGGPIACPVDGEGGDKPAMVHGGWQEARGGAIGNQYVLIARLFEVVLLWLSRGMIVEF